MVLDRHEVKWVLSKFALLNGESAVMVPFVKVCGIRCLVGDSAW